jgi:Glu-tRNA(Gln) amidotransferase subunit E-like FAD-binding protein
MYPDTDTPPIAVADARVETIRAILPERPWEAAARYQALGLEAAAAGRLVGKPWAPLFDALRPAGRETARRLAAALEKRLPHFRRRRGLAGLPDGARPSRSSAPATRVSSGPRPSSGSSIGS